jgi:hypothetical protein
VISTCTGPQRVEAESPVYVADPADEDDDADPADEDDDEDEDEDDGALVVGAAALLPLEVEPVALLTGATAEDSALAAAVDDVDVW